MTPDQARVLVEELDSPGSYMDRQTGKMIVTVSTDAAAERIRAAGGVARLVEHSGARLREIKDVLYRDARIPGTAWVVDPTVNQVVVSVDTSVGEADRGRINAVAARFGSAVRIKNVNSRFSEMIAGGMPIYGGGHRCSLGFNVRINTTYFLLTAGHCGRYISQWYTNSAQTSYIGPTVVWSYPGNDYAIVRYDNLNITHGGSVYLYNGYYRDIKTASYAYVGQNILRSGSTTGVQSGYVWGLGATINYPNGFTVSDLVVTTACADQGDSGGPFFSGTTALGLLSGGFGNCLYGGETYFQPVAEPMNDYWLSVY